MNRRTGSIPRASPGCERSCATSPTVAARCCCRVICSTRYRPPLIISSSSPAGPWWPPVGWTICLPAPRSSCAAPTPVHWPRRSRLRGSTSSPGREMRSPWTSPVVGSRPRCSRASPATTRCCSPSCVSPRQTGWSTCSSRSPPPRRLPFRRLQHDHVTLSPNRRHRPGTVGPRTHPVLTAGPGRVGQDHRYPRCPLASRSRSPVDRWGDAGAGPRPNDLRSDLRELPRRFAVGLVILLPVVAILMFTGEWSQRSVMTTFTQEPRRIRVLNAKLAASMVLGGGGAVFGGVVTAAGLGLAAASGRSLEADLTVGAITGYLLFVLLNVLAGVALGALLQSSATAIAASFALPAAFALLGTASTLVSDWIDMGTTWNWVLKNDWAGHVPQISFSIVFWVAVPLAAGVVRTMRRDVT